MPKKSKNGVGKTNGGDGQSRGRCSTVAGGRSRGAGTRGRRGSRGNRGRPGGRGLSRTNITQRDYMEGMCTMVSGELQIPWSQFLHEIYETLNANRNRLEDFLHLRWQKRGILVNDIARFLTLKGLEGHLNPLASRTEEEDEDHENDFVAAFSDLLCTEHEMPFDYKLPSTSSDYFTEVDDEEDAPNLLMMVETEFSDGEPDSNDGKEKSNEDNKKDSMDLSKTPAQKSHPFYELTKSFTRRRLFSSSPLPVGGSEVASTQTEDGRAKDTSVIAESYDDGLDNNAKNRRKSPAHKSGSDILHTHSPHTSDGGGVGFPRNNEEAKVTSTATGCTADFEENDNEKIEESIDMECENVNRRKLPAQKSGPDLLNKHAPPASYDCAVTDTSRKIQQAKEIERATGGKADFGEKDNDKLEVSMDMECENENRPKAPVHNAEPEFLRTLSPPSSDDSEVSTTTKEVREENETSMETGGTAALEVVSNEKLENRKDMESDGMKRPKSPAHNDEPHFLQTSSPLSSGLSGEAEILRNNVGATDTSETTIAFEEDDNDKYYDRMNIKGYNGNPPKSPAHKPAPECVHTPSQDVSDDYGGAGPCVRGNGSIETAVEKTIISARNDNEVGSSDISSMNRNRHNLQSQNFPPVADILYEAARSSLGSVKVKCTLEKDAELEETFMKTGAILVCESEDGQVLNEDCPNMIEQITADRPLISQKCAAVPREYSTELIGNEIKKISNAPAHEGGEIEIGAETSTSVAERQDLIDKVVFMNELGMIPKDKVFAEGDPNNSPDENTAAGGDLSDDHEKAKRNSSIGGKRSRHSSTSSSSTNSEEDTPVPVTVKLPKEKERPASVPKKMKVDLKKGESQKRSLSTSSESSNVDDPLDLSKNGSKLKDTKILLPYKLKKTGRVYAKKVGSHRLKKKTKKTIQGRKSLATRNSPSPTTLPETSASTQLLPQSPASNKSSQPIPSTSKVTSGSTLRPHHSPSSKQTSQPRPSSSKETRINCTEESCDRDFGRPASLKRHLKEVHGISNDEKVKKESFRCDEPGCTTMCTRKSDLKKHKLNKHAEGQKFTCELCGKGFKSDKSVKEHIKRTCKKKAEKNTSQELIKDEEEEMMQQNDGDFDEQSSD